MKLLWLLILLTVVSCTSKTAFERKVEIFRDLKLPLRVSSDSNYQKGINQDTASLHRNVYGRISIDQNQMGILHLVSHSPNVDRPYPALQLTIFDRQGRQIDSMMFFSDAGTGPDGSSIKQNVTINPDRSITIIESFTHLKYTLDMPGGEWASRDTVNRFRVNAKGNFETFVADSAQQKK
jgi:hypothetical protein